MAPQRKEDIAICSNSVLLVLGLLCVLIGVIVVIVGAVRINAVDKNCDPTQAPFTAKSIASSIPSSCNFSPEAVRVGLSALLDEVKAAYFLHNPNSAAWNPDLKGQEKVQYVKTR